MSAQPLDPDYVINLIHKKILPFAEAAGVDQESIKNDTDLLGHGVLDSFDVITILVTLEEELKVTPAFPEETAENFILSINWLAAGFLTPQSIPGE